MSATSETIPSSTSLAATPAHRRIFVANLVAQIGIVVTGGLVRLTGSGLGCPTWPQCVPGSYTPVAHQPESYHKIIEFGNRMLTFLLLVLAVAALVAGIRELRRTRRTSIRNLSAIPILGTVAQAVLGGLTVLTDLHPALVASHFLLSIAVIGGCVVLVHRAAEPGDQPIVRVVRDEVLWLARGIAAVALIVIVLGTVVTGSGPHSGDADQPARFGFDPRTVSWLHADVVMVFVGLVVALLVGLRLTDAPAGIKTASRQLVGITIAQGLLGYLQYFTGLPWPMVAGHMLLACLLWVCVLRVSLNTRTRGLASGTDSVTDSGMDSRTGTVPAPLASES